MAVRGRDCTATCTVTAANAGRQNQSTRRVSSYGGAMILDRLSGRVRLGLYAGALGGVLALSMLARAPGAQEATASTAATIAGLQARLANLDPQVSYLKVRRDIFDVSKRYTRGADRHDKDLVRSAFWPEATVSFGTPMSREEYVDWEEGVLAGYAAHQHHVTGQTVEVDDDTAHVESYVIYFLVPRPVCRAMGAAQRGMEDPRARVRRGFVAERRDRRAMQRRPVPRGLGSERSVVRSASSARHAGAKSCSRRRQPPAAPSTGQG
jgi:hypothetical protein